MWPFHRPTAPPPSPAFSPTEPGILIASPRVCAKLNKEWLALYRPMMMADNTPRYHYHDAVKVDASGHAVDGGDYPIVAIPTDKVHGMNREVCPWCHITGWVIICNGYGGCGAWVCSGRSKRINGGAYGLYFYCRAGCMAEGPLSASSDPMPATASLNASSPPEPERRSGVTAPSRTVVPSSVVTTAQPSRLALPAPSRLPTRKRP